MKLWHFSTQGISAAFRRSLAAFCCLSAIVVNHPAYAADAPSPRALIHQGDSTAVITDKLGPALAVIQNGNSIYLTYPEGRIVIQNDRAVLIPLALLSTAPIRVQPPLSGAPAMTGAANSPLPPAPVSAAAIPVVSVASTPAAPAAPASGGLAGVVNNARQKVVENNLSQISNAADQYMADKKVAQVTYKQLTTGPDAALSAITPASGESYDALVIHKDAAISLNVPGMGVVTRNNDGSTTVTALPAAGAKPATPGGNATAKPGAKPPAPAPEETGQTLFGYPVWIFEAVGLLVVVLGAVLFLKGKKSKKPKPAKDEKPAAPGAPAAPAKPGAPATAATAATPKPSAHATSKPIPLRTKTSEPPPPPAAPPPKPSSSTSAGSMGAEPPMTTPPMPVPPPAPPPPPPPPPSTPKLVMPSRAATPAPTPAAPASTPAPAPAAEPPKPAEPPKNEPPKPAETPPAPRLGLKLPSKPPTPPPGA